MGSDEAYLDNLLKSVSGDSGEKKAMTEEEIAALFSTAETPIESESDDILALDDTASDFDVEISTDDVLDTPFASELEDYDFVLDELNAESFGEPTFEALETPKEDTVQEPVRETESEFLNQGEVQSLMESDADLFDMPEDQEDLVDLENLDVEVELGTELIENLPVEIEEVPDTEEIKQDDMLDIASMFDDGEDLAEGVTYDTSGFYDEEPVEEDFNPFADMSDIDDLLKAVNWGAESEDTQQQVDVSDELGTDSLSDGVYLEDMDQLTSEDIESLLPKEEEEVDETDALIEDFDLSTLGDSENADMAELGALLQMADGESDAFDLFENPIDDTPSGGEILQMDEEDPKEKRARLKQEKAEEKAKKKAEKAAKKALKAVEDMPEPKYKAKKASDIETKEKKEGFFSKFVAALFEEEEEVAEKKKPVEEVIEIDENQDLLETLKKEDKDKKKKEKKEKTKKEKAPKPKKEKKEKPKKEKVIDLEPPAKIRRDSIIIIVGFAASLLVLVLLGNAIVEPIISKHNAKKAFEEMQYEECYQLFAGQKLSKEEQLMLDHASVVLKMERRLWKYEEYASLKDKVNALDTLFETVLYYDDWYQEALNCGARTEVENVYSQILSILDTYGISESRAQAIVKLDDVEYTRVITALAEGDSIESFFGKDSEAEKLPDLLPGETD